MRRWQRFALTLASLAMGCGDETFIVTDARPADAAEDAPPDVAGCRPCTYGAPTPVGTVAVAGATELSGLAVSRALADTVWSHNDSGDTARLLAFTTAGASLGSVALSGATAVDWEDLAIGTCGGQPCLLVADIGDNAEARASVRIYEVDEPALPTSATMAHRAFDVTYPDGAHNAEGLLVDPRDGQTYVITKQTQNPSTVFLMPRAAGAATAVEVAQLSIPTGSLLVTGADLYVDACGARALVRTYTALFEVRASAQASIAELFAAPLVSVPVAAELQGEAVAYLSDGRGYLTVSEGANPTLSRVTCP